MKLSLSLSTLALVILGLTTACTSFQRHIDSGYADTSRTGRSGWDKSSMQNSSSAIVEESYLDPLTQKMKLKILENSLATRREMEQYSKSLPFLADDTEKIEFLEAGSVEDRQFWLKERGIYERAQQSHNELERVAEAQDIALGMNEKLVVRAWGEPDAVEVSGQTRFKNQRWKYNKQVATTDGYFTDKRIVFFEGGRVVGWERD